VPHCDGKSHLGYIPSDTATSIPRLVIEATFTL